MSHTSTYEIKISDIDLLCKTALNAGHQVIFVDLTQERDVHLYGSNTAKAIASIHLTGWRFPIGINSKGELFYDHFGSGPNTMEKLGELMQKYSLDLIVNNMPLDKVNYFFDTVNDAGEFVLTLNY